MKKVSRLLIIALAVLLLGLCFVGCGKAKVVTFMVNGAEAIKVTADKEGKIFEPKIDIDDCYYIDGWYTDVEFKGQVFDFEKVDIKENINLYAKIASYNYAVTYNLGYTQPEFNEDMPSAPLQSSVNLDDTFEVEAVPTRIGYEFLGWTDGIDVYQSG